jgi:hypothetical protein
LLARHAKAALSMQVNKTDKNDGYGLVDEFKKNPTQATTRAVGDAAALAASIWAGGKLTGVLGEAGAADVAPEAEAATEAGTEPATATAGTEAEQPGLLQQVIKGEKVAQPPAQAAVRQAAGASGEAPILQGNTTVLDEPLANLKQQEQAAYKQVDDAAGFDLKAEKASLSNDQYKLAQLGNTDADIAARGNLTEAINSQDRIAEAEENSKKRASIRRPRIPSISNEWPGSTSKRPWSKTRTQMALSTWTAYSTPAKICASQSTVTGCSSSWAKTGQTNS